MAKIEAWGFISLAKEPNKLIKPRDFFSFLVPMLCVGTYTKAEKTGAAGMFPVQILGPTAGSGIRSTNLHSHAKHGNERLKAWEREIADF